MTVQSQAWVFIEEMKDICFMILCMSKLVFFPGSCDARESFGGEVCHRGEPSLHHKILLEGKENLVRVSPWSF